MIIRSLSISEIFIVQCTMGAYCHWMRQVLWSHCGAMEGDPKMFPLMTMPELQDAMVKQMMMASTHVFFIAMMPVQIMRTIWPVPLAAPQPKGRACMPFRI